MAASLDVFSWKYICRTWLTISIRIANTIYLLLTIYLILRKLKRTNTPLLRTQFKIVVIAVLNLQFIFLLFGVFSPLQISYAISVNHVFFGTLYYSKPQWYVIIAVSTALIVVGTIALWRYNKLHAQIGKPNIMLEKRIRENNMGVTVFTHGIKNQLLAQRVIIRNAKKYLSENEVEDEHLSNYVEVLQSSNEKILLRMDELYNTFKSNRMRLKPIYIKEIFDEAVDKVRQRENYNVPLTEHFENVVILADKPYLVQAVYNILSNAFDAINEKQSEKAGVVTFNCYPDGNMVTLEIKDNGVGIQRNKLRKIFEPFYTQKNTNQNWGLGLSYVQQMIKSHYGNINFKSFVGEGTTFYVFLPIYKGGQ